MGADGGGRTLGPLIADPSAHVCRFATSPSLMEIANQGVAATTAGNRIIANHKLSGFTRPTLAAQVSAQLATQNPSSLLPRKLGAIETICRVELSAQLARFFLLWVALGLAKAPFERRSWYSWQTSLQIFLLRCRAIRIQNGKMEAF
jgi:hypothetical protein